MQLPGPSSLTSEAYVAESAGQKASLPHCPRHPSGAADSRAMVLKPLRIHPLEPPIVLELNVLLTLSYEERDGTL
jgi:hypothetical protein